MTVLNSTRMSSPQLIWNHTSRSPMWCDTARNLHVHPLHPFRPFHRYHAHVLRSHVSVGVNDVTRYERERERSERERESFESEQDENGAG